MEYLITLNSGVTQVISEDSGKNPIGLWIWAKNQSVDKVLTFKDGYSGNEVAINSGDIAMITKQLDRGDLNG